MQLIKEISHENGNLEKATLKNSHMAYLAFEKGIADFDIHSFQIGKLIETANTVSILQPLPSNRVLFGVPTCTLHVLDLESEKVVSSSSKIDCKFIF